MTSRSMLVNRVGMGLVVMLGVWSGHAAAQQTGDVRGEVGTLPGVGTMEERSDRLEGHVQLLARSMEDALDDLQHADLKEFSQSYRRMVTAYNQLGDHVGDAAESIGDAETRLQLAARTLASAEGMQTVEPERRRKLGEDVAQVRAMLMGKLSAMRTRYEQAAEEDRGRMLQQMHALVNRIKQLDKLNSTLDNGTQPIVPGLAARDLAAQLDTVREALQEEEKMLGVISEAVRLMVDNTTHEMQRSLRLLEVRARIPSDLVAELTSTRKTVQRVLDEVTAAHYRATESAVAILAAGELPVEAVAQDEVLGEVDRLLNADDADSAAAGR